MHNLIYLFHNIHSVGCENVGNAYAVLVNGPLRSSGWHFCRRNAVAVRY